MGGSAVLLFCLLWFPPHAGAPTAASSTTGAEIYEPPRFRIDAPVWTLTDVPVRRVVITALTPEGTTDVDYAEQPYIKGLRLARHHDDDVVLGAFRHGVLELVTDVRRGSRVYIADDEIVVDPEGRRPISHTVRRVNRWWSLLPIVVVFGLAVWLRNALLPIFVGLLCGCVVLADGDLLPGFQATFEDILFESLVPRAGTQGIADYSHLYMLGAFVFFGALAGVASASGGISALSARLERVSCTREHGQLLVCALGLLSAFERMSQMLIVGPMLRPISDRLKISREKLAFLVDSTASSCGALFVVSLTFGTEFSVLENAYSDHGMAGSAFTAALASIQFQFYPIYLLVFVILSAFLGRDFGTMLRAESRALKQNRVMRRDAISAIQPAELPTSTAARESMINFLLPVTTFFVLVVVGAWWTGQSRLDAIEQASKGDGHHEKLSGMIAILKHCAPMRVLFFSSFIASGMALITAFMTRGLSVSQGLAAWVSGARGTFLPLILLWLSWGLARVCGESHLNTVGFLVELGHVHVSHGMLSALAFLMAAAMAFVTGSQMATMTLLLPLCVTIAHGILVDIEQAGPTHHLMLATIGALVGGAVCGRQCSLLGSETIVASAGAGSDHYDHVATQLPYALVVSAVSLTLGSLPAGKGFSPGVLLPIGTLVLFGLVQLLGRPADAVSESSDESPVGIIPDFGVDDATLTANAVDDMLKEVGATASAPGSTATAKSKS